MLTAAANGNFSDVCPPGLHTAASPSESSPAPTPVLPQSAPRPPAHPTPQPDIWSIDGPVPAATFHYYGLSPESAQTARAATDGRMPSTEARRSHTHQSHQESCSRHPTPDDPLMKNRAPSEDIAWSSVILSGRCHPVVIWNLGWNNVKHGLDAVELLS